MLGVKARATVRELLSGETTIEQVLVRGPFGVSLLPACSGDATLAEMSHQGRLGLFSAIDGLSSRFDTVVVDTGAGVGSNSPTATR